MAKFTQIPADTFQKIQLNAGILVDSFEPSSEEVGAIIGATTGGISFEATPEFSDFGEDIDNCPKNTMELKKLESWEVIMSGSFVTVDAASVKRMVGVGDVDEDDATHIVPRNDVLFSDFEDIWFVGDYSDVNLESEGTPGFIAIHLFNALSTGGFKLQTTDKEKGTFEFEFTGHYSIYAQDTVPYEIYIQQGKADESGETGATGETGETGATGTTGE